MSGPILPKDVNPGGVIPEEVFDTFNGLIQDRFTNGSAIIPKNLVVCELVGLGYTETQIYHNHFLDVEDAYRAVGWDVTYDKPGRGESYEAFYTFKKKP